MMERPRIPRMWLRLFQIAAFAGLGTDLGHAQITLTTAVDLALRNSPRVRSAEADVNKARAVLAETRDVFIPSVTLGGLGYGRSFGFPLGQPSLFNLQAQSLVFSYSQRDYIRASRAGLEGASLGLTDVREAVAEDTAITYLALSHDLAREAALQEEQKYAERLIVIVQDRLDAGQESAITLTSARLSLAQIRLAVLRTNDDTDADRVHLNSLTGLPLGGMRVAPVSMPEIVPRGATSEARPGSTLLSPAVEASFRNARSKREQAFGDARYLLRPQVTFASQYSRLSTYENSQYQEYFGRRDPTGKLLPFATNSIGVGFQINIPLLDYAHRAKARESAADAARAESDAVQQRDQFMEARLRSQRSVLELAARAEVADLEQQLAQQQLDILLVQLNSAVPGASGSLMSPKDEQNARIAERERFLALLDARFQVQQVQINLLRQTGQLEAWLKSAAQIP